MLNQCSPVCLYDRSNVSRRLIISVAMLLSLILSTSGGGKPSSFMTSLALLVRSDAYWVTCMYHDKDNTDKFIRCTTADSSLRQRPEWCTLEVLGYAQNEEDPVAKAISFFTPKDNPLVPMVETVLPPSFTTLSRVEFNVIATQPILYLDNVKYRTTNVTDLSGGLKYIIHGHETSQSEFQMRLESSERSF